MIISSYSECPNVFISDQFSILLVFTMSEIMYSQSSQHHDAQDQTEEYIRQGYEVRVVDGQEYMVSSALTGVELPLGKMKKPKLSQAVRMPGGVSIFSAWTIMNMFLIWPSSPSQIALHSRIRLQLFRPGICSAWSKHKVVLYTNCWWIR